jgi:hypothetical protein
VQPYKAWKTNGLFHGRRARLNEVAKAAGLGRCEKSVLQWTGIFGRGDLHMRHLGPLGRWEGRDHQHKATWRGLHCQNAGNKYKLSRDTAPIIITNSMPGYVITNILEK